MLTRIDRNKWEEYSRRIFYNERPKCVIKHEPNVNRMSLIRRTNPNDDLFNRYNKIPQHDMKVRSTSLTDLTGTRKHRKERRRSMSLTDKVYSSDHFIDWRLFKQSSYWTDNTNEAGRRIINVLMLNAWRRRREDNEEARGMVTRLTKEVDCLNMQMYVLRQLLCNSKTKAISAAKDLRNNLMKVEKLEEEKQLIFKEKECLESEIRELQILIRDLQSKCKNLENDLDTAKFESETWELRLKKERQKLEAAKEESACFRKEVRSKEYQLDYQSQCLEELNQTIKQLQQQLESQRFLLNQATDQAQSAEERLKLSDDLEREKNKIINEKNLEIKRLRDEIILMEEKFQAQDEKNGELQKLISEKTKELILVNEKLGEMTKNEKFWGRKMVKMASLCTRIPIACFYTVATLVLPHPWYRFL